MCRKNQMIGIAAIAFGFGLMVGGYFASGFWCGCAGFVVIAACFSFLGKKS